MRKIIETSICLSLILFFLAACSEKKSPQPKAFLFPEEMITTAEETESPASNAEETIDKKKTSEAAEVENASSNFTSQEVPTSQVTTEEISPVTETPTTKAEVVEISMEVEESKPELIVSNPIEEKKEVNSFQVSSEEVVSNLEDELEAKLENLSKANAETKEEEIKEEVVVEEETFDITKELGRIANENPLDLTDSEEEVNETDIFVIDESSESPEKNTENTETYETTEEEMLGEFDIDEAILDEE